LDPFDSVANTAGYPARWERELWGKEERGEKIRERRRGNIFFLLF
jgi:hypothetical protein